MARTVVAYTDIVDTDPTAGINMLEKAGFDVRVANSAAPDVIAQVARDAEALLIAYSPITCELLDRLPSLRMIATQSVGVDMIDLDACRSRGIVVSNLPSSATEEVAGHALALSLALVRGIVPFDRAAKDGRWDTQAALPARPSSLTVGVLGLGRIGRRFAEMSGKVFGTILGYDPLLNDVPGIETAEFNEVLTRSDILSLHLPLTAETRYVLDKRRISMLRSGVFVVNVSRGALIDGEALASSLDDGHVAGAGLDVFETEPPTASDPLWCHPRVLSTPHIAFLSQQSLRDYVVHQAENVVAFFSTGEPRTPLRSH